MTGPTSPAKPDELTMPSKDKRLFVEVFAMKGHEPFICGARGKACVETLRDIQRNVRENADDMLENGSGSYLFEATWFDGQYGFEGRCELEPGWDLWQVGFEKLEEQESPAEPLEGDGSEDIPF